MKGLFNSIKIFFHNIILHFTAVLAAKKLSNYDIS